jgi:hypothetical protein
LLAAVALWNPTVFTLAGRLLLPFRGALRKVAPFFTLQAAALALSLYLFSLDSLHLHSVLFQSILLPRYFTFGLLLFLAVEYKPARQEPLMWNLPAFWRGLAFVLAVEAASTQLPLLQGTTTLTRIGASLLLSQLVWPTNLDWNRAHKEILLTAGPIVLCAILSEMSVQLSVTDLPLRIFDPRMHPTGAVFFTFLSGIGLGFITGSFGVAYFALFMALMKTATLPLVKAALLDGILAGILLSPFSLLNWIPASQFGLTLSEVVAHRFKQLSFPLLIGLLIYAVSAINSVAILMPATFVFICLLAVGLRLKKHAWKLGRYTLSPDLRNAKH